MNKILKIIVSSDTTCRNCGIFGRSSDSETDYNLIRIHQEDSSINYGI